MWMPLLTGLRFLENEEKELVRLINDPNNPHDPSARTGLTTSPALIATAGFFLYFPRLDHVKTNTECVSDRFNHDIYTQVHLQGTSPIVASRHKSVEDLKDRFYTIQSVLTTARTASSCSSSSSPASSPTAHNLTTPSAPAITYDAEHERTRKRSQHRHFQHTSEQVCIGNSGMTPPLVDLCVLVCFYPFLGIFVVFCEFLCVSERFC